MAILLIITCLSCSHSAEKDLDAKGGEGAAKESPVVAPQGHRKASMGTALGERLVGPGLPSIYPGSVSSGCSPRPQEGFHGHSPGRKAGGTRTAFRLPWISLQWLLPEATGRLPWAQPWEKGWWDQDCLPFTLDQFDSLIYRLKIITTKSNVALHSYIHVQWKINYLVALTATKSSGQLCFYGE